MSVPNMKLEDIGPDITPEDVLEQINFKERLTEMIDKIIELMRDDCARQLQQVDAELDRNDELFEELRAMGAFGRVGGVFDTGVGGDARLEGAEVAGGSGVVSEEGTQERGGWEVARLEDEPVLAEEGPKDIGEGRGEVVEEAPKERGVGEEAKEEAEQPTTSTCQTKPTVVQAPQKIKSNVRLSKEFLDKKMKCGAAKKDEGKEQVLGHTGQDTGVEIEREVEQKIGASGPGPRMNVQVVSPSVAPQGSQKKESPAKQPPVKKPQVEPPTTSRPQGSQGSQKSNSPPKQPPVKKPQVPTTPRPPGSQGSQKSNSPTKRQPRGPPQPRRGIVLSDPTQHATVVAPRMITNEWSEDEDDQDERVQKFVKSNKTIKYFEPV